MQHEKTLLGLSLQTLRDQGLQFSGMEVTHWEGTTENSLPGSSHNGAHSGPSHPITYMPPPTTAGTHAQTKHHSAVPAVGDALRAGPPNFLVIHLVLLSTFHVAGTLAVSGGRRRTPYGDGSFSHGIKSVINP